MKDVVHATELRYLHLVPSGRDLYGAEIELVSAIARERRFAAALADLRDDYALILIDCPPSLGLLTLNALTAADAVIIPLQCEYYALEGLAGLLETIELVRQQLNPELSLEGIALTMVDRRNNLSRQVELEVRGSFRRAGLRDGDPPQRPAERSAEPRQAGAALRRALEGRDQPSAARGRDPRPSPAGSAAPRAPAASRQPRRSR